MRNEEPLIVVVMAAGIVMVFWAILITLISWAVVFLTGALHGSGLTQIPALSFWQSFGILTLIYLLTFPLRAGRRSGSNGR